MRRFAVSSWSLDGTLASGVPLLDLPAQLQQHGITTLEICHFHLPETSPAYLAALRDRLQSAGIELFSILIDTGDIATPDSIQLAADTALIQQWIEHAAALGAERVRVVAGMQPPTPQALDQSALHLHMLAQHAAKHGVKVSTENWHATSQEPDALLAILDRCPSPIGLCADTGNAEATSDKYATIARLLPRATSIHFKARYTPGGAIEQDDLDRCLALIKPSTFDGVITLIFDKKRDEWAGIQQLREALTPLL